MWLMDPTRDLRFADRSIPVDGVTREQAEEERCALFRYRTKFGESEVVPVIGFSGRGRPENPKRHRALQPYFEAAANACLFCSSFAITSPTLKLAGFCLGGNSCRVFIHCITIAAAGMSMYT